MISALHVLVALFLALMVAVLPELLELVTDDEVLELTEFVTFEEVVAFTEPDFELIELVAACEAT